jgi:hypothetical protein
MKYNDNFVLPPENVLEKMRQDYKATTANASILKQKKEVENQQITILPQNTLNNLYRGNFYREQLRRSTPNRFTRQRLQRIIDRTDKDIDRFANLYSGIDRDFRAPRIGINRAFCQLLREAIVAEIDVISQLFSLIKQTEQEELLFQLYEIMDERIEILRELTALLTSCGTRRF